MKNPLPFKTETDPGQVERHAELSCFISDQLWQAAETAFAEKKSAAILCKALRESGFSVEEGVGGIETAFTGRFGTGKPVIGLLGEFDALAGLSQRAGCVRQEPLIEGAPGHGCGHNLLGAGSLAAARAVKDALEHSGQAGTVIYFGCPGEEGGSGKTFMARDGVFDGLDVALTWHPEDMNFVRVETFLANIQARFRFRGVASHASSLPHLGRSALDAVELMNVGANFLREHVVPDARIHYAITDAGGYSPNVVQAKSDVLYLVRAPRVDQAREIYERVCDIARGAALMTGTRLEIQFVKACSNGIPNTVLQRLLQHHMERIPLPVFDDEDRRFAREIIASMEAPRDSIARMAGRYRRQERAFWENLVPGPLFDLVAPYLDEDVLSMGSTDVSDVSWVCPTAQLCTATWAAGTPLHSWQAVAQGKSPQAHKAMLFAAQIMADAAMDLFANPALIENAKQEHRGRVGERGYECPIPKDVQPQAMLGF